MLRKIQLEIGQWSRENFGHQISKVTGQALGSLAPLIGMGEEVGEFFAADNSNDQKDALGDILVYLCDFSCREQSQGGPYMYLDLESLPLAIVDDGDAIALPICIGRLQHDVLKHHQGIRQYARADYYRQQRDISVALILAACQSITKESFGLDVLYILDETWHKVVAKRN